MEIVVNGDRVTVEHEPLARVLEELGYACNKVVVAVNATFVPQAAWESEVIHEHDCLEVLAAIEGG